MGKISNRTQLDRARQRAMGVSVLLMLISALSLFGFAGLYFNYRSIGPLPQSLRIFVAALIIIDTILVFVTSFFTVRWARLATRCRQMETHCLQCGYDLSATKHELCPECGIVVDRRPPRTSVRARLLYFSGALAAMLVILAIFDVALRRQIFDLRAIVEPGTCLVAYLVCVVFYVRETRKTTA